MLIFMSGDADNLIDKAHSQLLYESFEGKSKHIEIFPGSHNSKRPVVVTEKIMRMIGEHVEKLDRRAEVTTQVRVMSQVKIGVQPSE